MSAIDLALPRVKANEGFSANLYNDSLGNPTIGYGCLARGWSMQFAADVCELQLQNALVDIEQYDWFDACDQVRQSVLLEMAFNLGLFGLLQLSKMLAAVKVMDWQTAHDEMLNSKWASQVKGRATRLAAIMLTGQP